MNKNNLSSTSLILHNIRSVYNVGGIFRTADAAGVDHIYLSGYTPRPIDRFGRWRTDFHKSALGSEKTVSWSPIENVIELIQNLKKDNTLIISVEQDGRSIDYRDIPQNKNIVLVFGNEVDGIEQEVLDQSDLIAEIPMKGKKESLNVMVSAGIVLYR